MPNNSERVRQAAIVVNRRDKLPAASAVGPSSLLVKGRIRASNGSTRAILFRALSIELNWDVDGRMG
jgi:hypothetical protein